MQGSAHATRLHIEVIAEAVPRRAACAGACAATDVRHAVAAQRHIEPWHSPAGLKAPHASVRARAACSGCRMRRRPARCTSATRRPSPEATAPARAAAQRPSSECFVPGRALHDHDPPASLACPGPQLRVGALRQSRAPRMSVQGLREQFAKVPGQGARRPRVRLTVCGQQGAVHGSGAAGRRCALPLQRVRRRALTRPGQVEG